MSEDKEAFYLLDEIDEALIDLYHHSTLSELPQGAWLVRPSFSNNVLNLIVVINYEILSLYRLWKIQDPFLFLNAIAHGIALAIVEYRKNHTNTLSSFLIKFSVFDSSGKEYKLQCKSSVLLGALIEKIFDSPFGVMTILDDTDD